METITTILACLSRRIRITKTAIVINRLEQLADLNRIIALKNPGLSLDEVRQMLENHISNHDISTMLKIKKDENEQRLVAERSRLRQVEARLQLLEQGYTPTTQPVIIKPVPVQFIWRKSWKYCPLAYKDLTACMDYCRSALARLPHGGGTRAALREAIEIRL